MNAKRRKIDWDEVRKRLAGTRNSLDKALEPDAEQVSRTLRERALYLSSRRGLRSAGPGAEGVKVQTFTLGEQIYALELKDLSRILPLGQVTPVPGENRALLGLINVQGEIRTVFDLKILLDPAAAEGAGGYVLFVNNSEEPAGFRVDSLGPVRNIPAAELGRMDGVAANCDRGVTAGRVVLLDAEKLVHKIKGNNGPEYSDLLREQDL